MRVVVLGAGYGTRLEADLVAEGSDSERTLLLGLPKALLPVGGCPLAMRWCSQLSRPPAAAAADGSSASPYAHVWVVHNDLHAEAYRSWANESGFPPSHLINDGTTENASRLGALRDLVLAVDAADAAEAATAAAGSGKERGRADPEGGQHESHAARWSRPLLVVAGDTLFRPDFDLADFLTLGLDAIGRGQADAVLTYYTLASDAEVSRRGVVELGARPDAAGLAPVRGFLEKPDPTATASRSACPPLYLYSPRAVALLRRYLSEHAGQLSLCDAPGVWIPWLLRHGGHAASAARIWAYGPLSGRFDIGSLQDYRVADAFFRSDS